MEPWNASFELGVPSMDTAHRALDGMVLDALSAVERSDAEALAATLASLGAAIVPHFQEEEGMMRRSRFPGTAEHATAHATFLGEASRARDDLERLLALDVEPMTYVRARSPGSSSSSRLIAQ